MNFISEYYLWNIKPPIYYILFVKIMFYTIYYLTCKNLNYSFKFFRFFQFDFLPEKILKYPVL